MSLKSRRRNAHESCQVFGLRGHVCRTKFAQESLGLRSLSHEKMLQNFPKFSGLHLLGPRKFHQNRVNFHARFPSKSQEIHGRASVGVQGELWLQLPSTLAMFGSFPSPTSSNQSVQLDLFSRFGSLRVRRLHIFPCELSSSSAQPLDLFHFPQGVPKRAKLGQIRTLSATSRFRIPHWACAHNNWGDVRLSHSS